MWSYTLPAARSIEILNDAGYPLFAGAPGCARAMRALADHRRLRERMGRIPEATAPPMRDGAAAVLARARDVLCEWEARPLLALYGIGAHDFGRLARTAAEAERIAQAIDGPVALKVQSPDIPHKTEASAVALNVRATEAAAECERVLASARRHNAAARIDGVLVQPMAKPGREVIVGVSRDERWGPMLMAGLGGVHVEAIGDVALASVPLDRDAALRLIEGLKGAAVLGAWRGAPPADIDALAGLMVSLSHFAADHANEIAAIDLNPVIVHDAGEGVTVADALIVRRTGTDKTSAAAE